ncbi:hypothetical protein KXV97_005972 [Aspergillus fumigatus]|uniref:C6 finger domain protein, putative n=1 Tax=Aspergillus fumigatus (strain CBS 144.89 / FGSC A1163 / CEA10) TaxID=451804 RepID=B0YDA5_ASPFC|nr:C6 finger domain protein, putative [Aspergillus fumigatus A1163]KAH1762040.1 hypothetical protein KXX41_005058 [Aspergillus fumigatus]KAH2002777.1 hypothetical protein KXV97_005972 [Aspergillus fumigatus]KAH2704930.1 hypothetical protein KXV24_003056 [Aspergillus fumigatus]KAH2794758.1 hypothetical protein KXW38_000325 [Aspergillus fumigatus]
MMDDKHGRYGACDRCRGQKLRCVGAGKPIPNSSSRLLRNEIPCDRCRRAKVECYSVRPAPRRAASNVKEQMIATQAASERSSSLAYHTSGPVVSPPNSLVTAASKLHPNSLSFNHPRSDAVAAPGGLQTRRQSRDTDSLGDMPSMPHEWMAYLHDHKMDDRQGLGMETPPLIESDLNLSRDPAMDSMHEHNMMMELIHQDHQEEWNSGPPELEAYPDPIVPPNPAPLKARKLTSPDCDDYPYGHTRRSSHTPTQPPEPAGRSCIQELAQFNEMLLRDKCSLEDTSARRGYKDSWLSIGRTLHHCQQFFSILKRIKYSRPDSQLSADRARSQWSSLPEGTSLADGAPTDSPQARRSLARGATPCSSSLARSSSTSSAASTSYLGLSTLLSILFCYTYILQAYEDILTSILHAVTRPTPTIPPTLSGLRIDGFQLDGHHTLQLECLLHVSYNLLEKIENILFGSAGPEELSNPVKCGILGDKLSAGLIDALFEHNETNGLLHCQGKREVAAKRLIREIQAALKQLDL